eukprot:9469184-Pyramimonas_sp.AAC.2
MPSRLDDIEYESRWQVDGRSQPGFTRAVQAMFGERDSVGPMLGALSWRSPGPGQYAPRNLEAQATGTIVACCDTLTALQTPVASNMAQCCCGVGPLFSLDSAMRH